MAQLARRLGFCLAESLARDVKLLAHIFERVLHVGIYRVGASIVFSSGDPRNFAAELKAVRPTLLAAVPRVMSRLYDGVMGKVAEAGDMKKNIFNTAVKQKVEAMEKNNTVRVMGSPAWVRVRTCK